MPNSRSHIVIACKDYLYRLGLKSLMGVIGVEAELKMVDTFSKLKDMSLGASYLLVYDDVLADIPQQDIIALSKQYKGRGIMLIGEKDISEYENVSFLSKNMKEEDLVQQLQAFFFDRDDDSAEESILTEREIEVLRKVAQGYANKEIADKLFISINTVITHRKNITEKLGIKTIAGLTVYALMNKVTNPDEVQY